MEQILAHLPDTWRSAYYRISAGAEIDLVLEGPRGRTLGIEIKRSSSPSPSKGFQLGCDDFGATERFLVMPHGEEHAVGAIVRAIALCELVQRLAAPVSVE